MEREGTNLWVVAAATGASCVAKYYWHKWFSKERTNLSESVQGSSRIRGDSAIDLASSIGGEDEERLEELTESSGELVSDICATRKAGYNHGYRCDKKCCFPKKEEVLGSCEERNWKQNMEKARRRGRRRCSSSTRSVSGGLFHSQGSQNGMLLFFSGIGTGIMYTIIAHKREFDKLNELLKQTQKLVQRLHEEEVEMTFLNGTLTAFSPGEKLQKSKRCVAKRIIDHTVDDVEAMSKLEAELLAELELLELSINRDGLNTTPDSVELDPDFVADVIQEDPRLDHYVNGSSNNYSRNENKAASPRELSLRLHEVIELRLEARIMELETALEASKNRVLSIDLLSQRGFKVESSSNQWR